MSNQTQAKPFGGPAQKAPLASRRPVISISAKLFYGLFAALCTSNVLTLVGLLMSPDIAGLINGHTQQVVSGYEDRVAQLRIEVDRLHSRQYAQTGDINLQLQELSQQQEILTEQHQYVKALVAKASELGIDAAPVSKTDAPPVPAKAGGDNSASDADGAPLITGSIAIPGMSGADQIEAAGHAVRQMMDESRTALASLSDAATTSTNEIVDELHLVGIKPKLPEGTDAKAMGGPLLPPQDGANATGADTSMVDDANQVVTALARFKVARTALASAPVHLPLVNPLRISSPFGNRKDPFSGRLAFHPGVDFPNPNGTTVLAAGAGVVSFVGQIPGYGNAVEIDHGNGLITRYGHLSSFIAQKGDKVVAGTPIARVGSTGRSTGPHLHFEFRRNDLAIDPMQFINVGKRLKRFASAIG
ncbi:MAG: family metallopeptidase [Hyphomicrobiales bacterium]|nr:family metallopeptidase [Hyphomicrobiales bacterium]